MKQVAIDLIAAQQTKPPLGNHGYNKNKKIEGDRGRQEWWKVNLF